MAVTHVLLVLTLDVGLNNEILPTLRMTFIAPMHQPTQRWSLKGKNYWIFITFSGGVDQSYSPRVCHFRSQSLIIQLNRLSKIAIHFDTSAGHAFAISVYTENRFAFDEEPLSFICCFAKKSKIKMVLLSLLWQKWLNFSLLIFRKKASIFTAIIAKIAWSRRNYDHA